MRTGLIVLTIIMLVLMGGVVFFYFAIEKPNQALLSVQHNYSIRFVDEISGEVIITNYTIYLDGAFYKRGISKKLGFVLERVPFNKSVDIFSESKTHYTTRYRHRSFSSQAKNIRAEVIITPHGRIDIFHRGEFILGDDLSLNISSKGLVRQISVCLRWSSSFITVSIPNQTLIDVPPRLENKVDKCYKTREVLKNSSVSFPIDYKLFRSLDLSDNIKVIVLDADITPESVKTCPGSCYTLVDLGGNDIAIPDIEYVIK